MSGPGLALRIGLWLEMPEPIVVEMAGRAGADWVGLDLQHGAWDLGTAFRGIQLLDAIGVPALVRVSEQEMALIPRLLDHGASGVVIAMATGPGLAIEAVRLARYAPEGERSYGGQRYGLRPEPADVSEVRPLVYPMIEDARGVAAVGEIASVPGVAGLHIGPVDLGLGMGLGMDRSGVGFREALATIVAAGHAAGVTVTLHAVDAADAPTWTPMGFDEIVLPADVALLKRAFAEQVATVRGGRTATVGAYGREG